MCVTLIFRWGQPWNHGDYQHTSMGVIWWAAGLVGIALSRNGNRTVIPSILIILTAVSFQGHAQHVANSGAIHSYFGYMLAAGGLSRIIEICFVWKEDSPAEISPWQYIPPLVSNCTFMQGFVLIYIYIDIGVIWIVVYGIDRRAAWFTCINGNRYHVIQQHFAVFWIYCVCACILVDISLGILDELAQLTSTK